MRSIINVQHWLYSGMASGLGQVAAGNFLAIFAAVAAAVRAIHALMPGHGKTVLVSYYLWQRASGSRLPRVAKGRVQGDLWMLAKIAHAAAVAELFRLNGVIAEPFAAPVTVVLQSRS
jgi:hypothetical protein